MSYFMNNGAKVAQAAAGLGALARQPGFSQAATNGIGWFGHASKHATRPKPIMVRPANPTINGLGAVAETPSVIGGDIVNVYRDGIFAEGREAADYGELTNVYNDGIFGGSIRSGLGAAGGSLDLRSPAVLRQVKMMIRSIDPNLPVSDIDVPYWTTDTENSWHTAVYATAIKTNTPPAAASTWNQKVHGHDVPTTQGLYSVFGYAVQGVAPNYAETYWPDLAAWIKSGGAAIHAPRTSAGGMTTAKMFGFGAAAAGVVLAGMFLLKKKRHAGVTA